MDAMMGWFIAGVGLSAFVFTALYFFSRQKSFQEKSALQNQLSFLQNQLLEIQQKLKTSQEDVIQLNRDCAAAETEIISLKEKLHYQKHETEVLQQQFKAQFENLAQKIFEEKSEKFSRQNQFTITQIVDPLKEKLKEFEEKSRITHKEHAEQSTILREQINHLKELGARMTDETRNLTQALKGDTKKQGNWGELVLDRILEISGLEKGREYEMQLHTEDESGFRQIPDAVIFMPDNKHIIIDAKVSLVAYEEWNRVDDELQKQRCLIRHIDSIKKHISGLGEKHYISAKGFHSPDFVLMFMPVEACLAVSLQADNNLFEYAWKRKIVLVTPTTLLATLKTVSSLWKYEKQNTNAQKIAEMGRKMYEQFVDFMDEMERIEKSIDGAKYAYTEAINRLKNSSHSIIRRAEKLKEFGIAPKKHLKTDYVDLPEDIIEIEKLEEE
ncbi:MAG: DNA recombination protein RmuC [Bacteroidia bacterium]